MASGGSRNRSGPPKDPQSGRSDRLAISLTALPAEGFRGKAPSFPLPARAVLRWEFSDGGRFQVKDDEETERVADRELEMWAWAWSTPQACAWALPSESWRLLTIAMWVRTFVVCESSTATAADKGSLHRFADQIGMTPAGLVENGWAIAQDELAQQAAKGAVAEPAQPRKSSRDRMTVVSGNG